MGTRRVKPYTLRGGSSTKLGKRRLGNPTFNPRTLPSLLKPDRVPICTISGDIPLFFVEANYEVLESLLREQRKQIRNKDLRTELEYFSEEYDKEREMESRPERARETTLVLRTRSPRARRQRERVVEFEEALNKEGGRVERNAGGGKPSEPGANGNRGQDINLPPLLAAHVGRNKNGQPPIFLDLRIRRPPAFD
ncbi:hypothetical protein Tco_0849612 [Tanacetum coccineum]